MSKQSSIINIYTKANRITQYGNTMELDEGIPKNIKELLNFKHH